jgi:pSer/pThr/pTyr-binding forkhead associated (FHA) protein
MSATVTLKVIEGPLYGAEYVYRVPILCAVGRSSDCELRLPNDDPHLTVSRHHCLLEIDPPLVRVCDLGSLNGTFVNGEPIGRRDRRGRPDDYFMPGAPDHPLKDGDALRVGDTVFRVAVGAGETDGERAPCAAACEEVC